MADLKHSEMHYEGRFFTPEVASSVANLKANNRPKLRPAANLPSPKMKRQLSS